MTVKELFNLSNRAYELFKWLVQILLPAIGVFYATVATIWNLPYADAVMATSAALALLLGSMLKVSSANYAPPEAPLDGVLNIDESNAMTDTYSFDLASSLFDLKDGDVVSFKVNHTRPSA